MDWEPGGLGLIAQAAHLPIGLFGLNQAIQPDLWEGTIGVVLWPAVRARQQPCRAVVRSSVGRRGQWTYWPLLSCS